MYYVVFWIIMGGIILGREVYFDYAVEVIFLIFIRLHVQLYGNVSLNIYVSVCIILTAEDDFQTCLSY